MLFLKKRVEDRYERNREEVEKAKVVGREEGKSVGALEEQSFQFTRRE